MIVLSVAAAAEFLARRLTVSLTVFSLMQLSWAISAHGQSVSTAPQPVTTSATTSEPGTLCPIRIASIVESRSVKVGDPVEATLEQSLLMTTTYNAPPGSRVLGRVFEVDAPRTKAQSLFSSERRLKTDSCLGIVFEEVICPDGSHFRINGRLARQKKVVHLASGHVRRISVNGDGLLTSGKEALSTPVRVRNMVGQNAIGVASLAVGGIPLYVAPLALGAAGTVSPSFASNKPVDSEVKHPRLRGFLDGVVDGLPGSFVLQSLVEHGDRTSLLPGDELIMTCAPSSGNALVPPAAQTRVYGAVISNTESIDRR